MDYLFGIVVSTSDCHPRGPGFDSQLHHHQCSAQGQVLHCKLRHQGCNSAQRQVFRCKLRNLGCSFTRDEQVRQLPVAFRTIPSYTLEIFLEAQVLERDPPSLVRTIGQLLGMKSSEIRLRKLKLRLRDNALLTTRPPVLPFGSSRFSRFWLFGAVAPWILI